MVKPLQRAGRVIPVLAAAALLAACTPPAPMLQPTGSGPPPSEDLASYYTQDVDWTDCGDGFSCGRVTVPMNYDEPDGETIELSLKVHEATGQSQGALLTNPGGPGSSGVELVESASMMFGEDLLAGFDLVGFDPRGVGDSDSVACYDSEQLQEYFGISYDVETDEGWEDYVEEATTYGESCLENTGPLLEFVDTISSAKDMDILRAVLDQPQLTYLGFSYGTFLGATYAELFPDRVGRFVLDGAVDPSLDYATLNRGQIEGFDVAFRSYIEDCQAGPDCVFDGDVQDGIDVTVDLLATLADDPMTGADPDRPVTDADLLNAIVVALYLVDNWPVLTEALSALIEEDDPSQVQFMSDFAMEREPDGSYPEDQGAFRAINCLDYPVELDRDAITAEAEVVEGLSEVFGPYFGYGEVGCATLPFQSEATRAPISAPGTPPIVVIGTTRDPATPHEWAEAMADQLESGILISYDGDGHTAYGGTSACVNEAVESFLLDGVEPPNPLEC